MSRGTLGLRLTEATRSPTRNALSSDLNGTNRINVCETSRRYYPEIAEMENTPTGSRRGKKCANRKQPREKMPQQETDVQRIKVSASFFAARSAGEAITTSAKRSGQLLRSASRMRKNGSPAQVDNIPFRAAGRPGHVGQPASGD